MIVINLFGGPGSGKSTTCAGLFAKLKLAGVNCEMALEYAKDKVWEESYKTLNNQIYVFGKQLHKLFRLKDKVDVIITDSPILLSIYYDKTKNPYLKDLVLDQFNSFRNLNYFVVRDETYNPNGRIQTKQESENIDEALVYLLKENNIDYGTVNKNCAIDAIFNDIIDVVRCNIR